MEGSWPGGKYISEAPSTGYLDRQHPWYESPHCEVVSCCTTDGLSPIHQSSGGLLSAIGTCHDARYESGHLSGDICSVLRGREVGTHQVKPHLHFKVEILALNITSRNSPERYDSEVPVHCPGLVLHMRAAGPCLRFADEAQVPCF
ncbi:hypothetical protein HAX54_034487 [Datura stramonium]|uniref:Uncharacterized protein n=1 Tax=Datura stramonium TaxID=4076 RepID=A0ABS8VHR0_DATST|nr:hypothetical protein [Datura stramonium]